MTSNSLFTLTNDVVDESNIKEVMTQAITLELATIPTYLSTYYSINRAQDQDVLFAKLKKQLANTYLPEGTDIDVLAQELKLDILVYANKSAALTMSVVIEEMLHLALACNVKQALCQSAPDLMAIGKTLTFPAHLAGHTPEFKINTAQLSLDQLTTFLMIESPDAFTDPKAIGLLQAPLDYKTIGGLYQKVIDYANTTEEGEYIKRPQLLPPNDPKRPRPFYSQNSINTVHYDRSHCPKFANTNDEAGLQDVTNKYTAVEALHRIVEQGEGSTTEQNKKPHHTLEWDSNGMAVPMALIDGEDGGKKGDFKPGDYEDGGEELSHFSKFLELYSLGVHYDDKFKAIGGLDEFYSYFTYNQGSSPTQADYDASGNEALALCSKLGNAVFAYILLLIEACYHKDESTQYDLFMYGVHKSMIWLLSGVGNKINQYTYTSGNQVDSNGNITSHGTQAFKGALTFEPFAFDRSFARPKAQILEILSELAEVDPYWSAGKGGWSENYFPSLPDVGLDHSIVEDMPNTPSTPYTKH